MVDPEVLGHRPHRLAFAVRHQPTQIQRRLALLVHPGQIREDLTGEILEPRKHPRYLIWCHTPHYENIHYLIRLQRLAAIGASLPARSSAPWLSLSRLRNLPRHPLVSGQGVQSTEDLYDDIYVLEVPFDGGHDALSKG